MKLDKIAILIFAYSRPSHLKRVLIAMEDYNITSDIILIVDGPKNKADKINQENILAMAKRFKSKNFKLVHRKKNLGLSKSILQGINYFSKKYEGLIIIEDDVVPYKSFFSYIKHFFYKYKNDKNISAICGYQFQNFISKKSKVISEIILPNFTPWGWAISSSKWRYFINNKNNTLFKHQEKVPTFLKKYFRKEYYENKKGNIWTLDFILHNYLNKKMYIYPNFSLVKNIGFDGTGINCKTTNVFKVNDQKINKISFKLKKKINKNLILKQNKFFKKYIKYFY